MVKRGILKRPTQEHRKSLLERQSPILAVFLYICIYEFLYFCRIPPILGEEKAQNLAGSGFNLWDFLHHLCRLVNRPSHCLLH